jgi:hypothetical protein
MLASVHNSNVFVLLLEPFFFGFYGNENNIETTAERAQGKQHEWPDQPRALEHAAMTLSIVLIICLEQITVHGASCIFNKNATDLDNFSNSTHFLHSLY